MVVHPIESIQVVIIEGIVLPVMNQNINILVNILEEVLNIMKLRKIMNIPNLMNIDMEREGNQEAIHHNINI